jgi:hypothetical protein
VHPNSGSGLRRRACSLLGFAWEDLNEGVVVTGSAEADAVATVVESLALSRPEKVNPGRSECWRRKTKDARDEDYPALSPIVKLFFAHWHSHLGLTSRLQATPS